MFVSDSLLKWNNKDFAKLGRFVEKIQSFFLAVQNVDVNGYHLQGQQMYKVVVPKQLTGAICFVYNHKAL